MNKPIIIDGIDTHLNTAINYLIMNYEKAKQNPMVENPTNYAFYHTWKYLDRVDAKGIRRNEYKN